VLVCTIGDLLLDVIVRLDGPIAADTDAYGRTRVGAGGQASNVAAWVADLGGRSRVIAKRAADPAGRIVAEELARRGVELAGPEVGAGTGTIVSIATPDGGRAMLSDRGVCPSFTPGELDAASLEGCDWLHVTGYSLAQAPLSDTALAAAARAPRVSLDLSSTAAIEAAGVGRFRELAERVGPALVLANEAEAALVGRLEAETVVVKRGAHGCRVNGVDYPAHAAEVVDGTGAGDAFAAGFLLGGPEAALGAAARCVAQLGAMP
jgi:sugar/nucleoside kinase (ribokinase family)